MESEKPDLERNMNTIDTVGSDDDIIEFLDLPAHLIEIMLTKLDPFSICNLSRTSRLLQKLTRQDHIWSKYGCKAVQDMDCLLAAAQECLASITHLPPQVFRVEAHEETSQKFPLTCHLRKAAATTIPHVRMLLGLSDSGAQDLSSIFQDRILKRRKEKTSTMPVTPFDVFTTARADRGEVRLGLMPSVAVRVIQRQLRKDQGQAGQEEGAPQTPCFQPITGMSTRTAFEARIAALCLDDKPTMSPEMCFDALQRTLASFGEGGAEVTDAVAELATILIDRCSRNPAPGTYWRDYLADINKMHDLICDSHGVVTTVCQIASGYQRLTEGIGASAANLSSLWDRPLVATAALTANKADLALMMALRHRSQEVYSIDPQTGSIVPSQKLQLDPTDALHELVHLTAHVGRYIALGRSQLLPSGGPGQNCIPADFAHLASLFDGALGGPEDAALQGVSGGAASADNLEVLMSSLKGDPASRHVLLRVLLQVEALRVMDTCLHVITQHGRALADRRLCAKGDIGVQNPAV